MLNYIAQPPVVFVALAGLVAMAGLVVALRWRKGKTPARIVRELNPVSQHWLTEFRRRG
jgi:hypothetical protein